MHFLCTLIRRPKAESQEQKVGAHARIACKLSDDRRSLYKIAYYWTYYYRLWAPLTFVTTIARWQFVIADGKYSQKCTLPQQTISTGDSRKCKVEAVQWRLPDD